MDIRIKQELWEKEYYSRYAAFSCESRGRDIFEEPCDIRPIYQRDRDRILHCKSFRRLKDKTQVFLVPQGDHYRTRLTHTLEVSQNARTIAKALHLNEDLTEAIALGHDLGHTPFGHAGERALNQICTGGFKHNVHSIRVVEKLEKKGQGLNLSWEVRDGILNHQTSKRAATLEGRIVRISDKIAYINHDIDDAVRAQILTEEDLPKEYTRILGDTVRGRINKVTHDVISHSEDKDDITMSKEVEDAIFGLRKFMFEQVYTNPKAKFNEGKSINLLTSIFEYYLKHIEELPEGYVMMLNKGDTKEQVICDYIAGMTDHYAITCFQELFEPQIWRLM